MIAVTWRDAWRAKYGDRPTFVRPKKKPLAPRPVSAARDPRPFDADQDRIDEALEWPSRWW